MKNINFNWINLELSSHCQKQCDFCGRAKAHKERTMETGDIDLELLNYIVGQFKGSIIQMNRDGEPLLYPQLWAVGQICKDHITNIVTNGILLFNKRDALVDNFTSITISVIEDDAEQLETVGKFIEFKKDRSPMVAIKFLGDYYNPEYKKLGLKTMKRSIHNPDCDVDYQQGRPPLPELQICLDFLMKPSIDWQGNFYICNRYDPDKEGMLGNCYKQSLDDIRNSDKRFQWLELHKQGKRELVSPCSQCDFYGVPTVC